MLDLLRRREMPPAGRQVGDPRHEWESNDAAIVEADAELARSLEWGACHLARVCGRRVVRASAHPLARA